MVRKRHSDEDILKILREIEVHLAGGADVSTDGSSELSLD